MNYEQWLQQLAPPWLLRMRSALWIQGHGATFDDIMRKAVEAVSVRFIQNAPTDALYHLGEERMLPGYAQETPEAYRARVQGAWEYWQWAGTNEGIRRIMKIMGYDAEITEYPGDPEFWAHFSVTLTAIDVTVSAARYDDLFTTYDDGTPYDVTIRAADPARLRGIVNSMKSAQSKVREIKLVTMNPNRYDTGLTYDSDATYLDATEIYL